MLNYKSRVNFQVGKTITLQNDEMGSYMLLYFIGENIEEKIKAATKGVFKKSTVKKLLDSNLHIVVKAGTTANRKSGVEPYNIRGREILNELGRCFHGVTEGADVATRIAFGIMYSDIKYECHAVMVALDKYPKHAITTDIESDVKNHVFNTYGIVVANEPGKATVRSTERWGRKNIPLKF